MVLQKNQTFKLVLCLWIVLLLGVIVDVYTQPINNQDDVMVQDQPKSSKKKELKDYSPPVDSKETIGNDNMENKVVIISEKTLLEKQQQQQKAAAAVPATMINKEHSVQDKPVNERITTQATPAKRPEDNYNIIHVEESSYIERDTELPNSFKVGFYIFLSLSCAAVLFIVVKFYRMRLSRAERRYGVQGDRAAQELTPLPISIEDGNSDEEDQTLFEINRQQMRIL